MILNAKQNQFAIYFPKHFFYPEVIDKWSPIIQRFKLPFKEVSDYVNSTIQSIAWPSLDFPIVEQQQSQFNTKYKAGKEMEPLFDKTMTVTFKLSEGFVSYWIWFDQIAKFLEYANQKPCFMDPLFVSFLDNNGFALMDFNFKELTPSNLSQFEISYSNVVADFSTISVTFKYNRFDIKSQF